MKPSLFALAFILALIGYALPMISAPAQASSDAPGKLVEDVPVLTIESNRWTVPGWSFDDPEGAAPNLVARPGEAGSPRITFWVSDLSNGKSLDQDLAIFETGDYTEVDLLPVIEVPSHELLRGNKLFVTVGTVTYKGHRQQVALSVVKDGENPVYNTQMLQASPAQFDAWGGILGALLTFRIYDDPAAFPPPLRQGIAALSWREQWPHFARLAEDRSVDVASAAGVDLTGLQLQGLRNLRDANQQMSEETGCIMTGGC